MLPVTTSGVSQKDRVTAAFVQDPSELSHLAV